MCSEFLTYNAYKLKFSYQIWVGCFCIPENRIRLKPVFRYNITFWICVLVLWINKGYCVVKKLVWIVRIKTFWYTNGNKSLTEKVESIIILCPCNCTMYIYLIFQYFIYLSMYTYICLLNYLFTYIYLQKDNYLVVIMLQLNLHVKAYLLFVSN